MRLTLWPWYIIGIGHLYIHTYLQIFTFTILATSKTSRPAPALPGDEVSYKLTSLFFPPYVANLQKPSLCWGRTIEITRRFALSRHIGQSFHLIATTNALRAAVGKFPHIKGVCRYKVRCVWLHIARFICLFYVSRDIPILLRRSWLSVPKFFFWYGLALRHGSNTNLYRHNVNTNVHHQV